MTFWNRFLDKMFHAGSSQVLFSKRKVSQKQNIFHWNCFLYVLGLTRPFSWEMHMDSTLISFDSTSRSGRLISKGKRINYGNRTVQQWTSLRHLLSESLSGQRAPGYFASELLLFARRKVNATSQTFFWHFKALKCQNVSQMSSMFEGFGAFRKYPNK